MCMSLFQTQPLDTLTTLSSSVLGGISTVTAGKEFTCVESQQMAEVIVVL